MNKLSLNAYYYSFNETGVLPVDKILEAVAKAGKAYHHTDSWNDEEFLNGEGTPVELIQKQANICAEVVKNFKDEFNNLITSELIFYNELLSTKGSCAWLEHYEKQISLIKNRVQFLNNLMRKV